MTGLIFGLKREGLIMKNTLNKFWIAAFVVLSAATPAKAFFGAGDVVHDPISMAKSAADSAVEIGNQATMISNQIEQYRNMIYNTVTLANPVLKPIGDLARTAASTYYRGQNLLYQAQNLDQQFGYMYPSYMNYQSYMMNVGRGGQTMEAKYRDWSDKGYNNVRNALQAANIQADAMESDSSMLDKLVNQANSTGGQMQALQGIGQLMGQQSAQMTGLQNLLLTQVRMQANFYATEIERQSAFDASLQGFKTPRSLSTGAGF
ncbi:MAG TPA: P-type conjugative transfer protein TrbJ [Nitrosospira sp.]|nr:P-type conjugative transfer protein TrbJ [Nitrosospira sp.]